MSDWKPFKLYYDTELAELLGSKISVVYPQFPHGEFVKYVDDRVEPLELKARVAVIADGLRQSLPASYPAAVKILQQTLGPPLSSTEGMFNEGYYWMPVAYFVEKYGLDHLSESLDAIYEITQRFTSEFAIRPYLKQYPEATLATVRSWVTDPSEHIRRLVSEGLRPRLPWGGYLEMFIENPDPLLEILAQLKNDPSPYVRKSVANNLNDIAKDHAGKVLAILDEWQQNGSEETRWIVRHALRSLIKKGDPGALRILGYRNDADITLENFSLSPENLPLGEALSFNFNLVNNDSTENNLMIDFLIHFMKANGKTQPKVFKLTTRSISPGEKIEISKKFPIKPVTTRKYYPGNHRLEIQVNGRILGGKDFKLST